MATCGMRVLTRSTGSVLIGSACGVISGAAGRAKCGVISCAASATAPAGIAASPSWAGAGVVASGPSAGGLNMFTGATPPILLHADGGALGAATDKYGLGGLHH